MYNALSIIESLDLSYGDLKHLSERIEDLSRIKENDFWKRKLYEWYDLQGEFDIFGEVYSTKGFEYNTNSDGVIIFNSNDDDHCLILTFERDSHKPISLDYRCETDWKYEACSRRLLCFKDHEWIPTTLKEFYLEESEEFTQYTMLIIDVDILCQAIFH
jgi:hypothetical protein